MNRKRLYPSALDLHQSALAAMTALKDKVEVSRVEEVPADFFTRREVEVLWNLSQSQAGKRINEALEAGLMERRDFRVLQGKAVKPRPHYRVVQ